MTSSPLREPFRFGTKAETLESLAGRLETCTIPPLVYFTVERWRTSPDEVFREVRARLGEGDLAVRSSALSEDGEAQSRAGAHDSVLGVKGGRGAFAAAVESVLASYAGGSKDQVLVQPMVEDVAASGVLTTRSLVDGGPYYEINYDDLSGRTDTITGGVGANKTVVVHRDAPESYVSSARVRRWLTMARELERLTRGLPLDVEFAEDARGALHLLQVRRITAERGWDPRVEREVDELLPHLCRVLVDLSRQRHPFLGRRTILGEMPDWNPAEILGTTPRPLAVSLYRELVTDAVWREARGAMGYRNPEGAPLLVVLAGRPYVDVRASLNSFLPADLPDAIGARLVDAWLEHLDGRPEKHDKVEFEVATTALDFCFETVMTERFAGVLDAEALDEYRTALRRVTRAAIDVSEGGTLMRALAAARELEERQLGRKSDAAADAELMMLEGAARLLREAVELGTRPFAVVARHAFIAEALLRSAVARGALEPGRLSAFRRSVRTITRDMASDVRAVLVGSLESAVFLERYGHLRPGTYDILSARYDQREDLFRDVELPSPDAVEPFIPTSGERRALEALLAEARLDVDVDGMLAHAHRAVVAREHVKFVFSRNLSDALELLAGWGARLGVSREELSYVPLSTLLELRVVPRLGDARRALEELIQRNRASAAVTRGLRLNYLLRDERDVYVVPLHRAAPNFVGATRVEGRVVMLDAHSKSTPEIAGAVVCIENADPGFDWIFLRGIAGLVTKFGGANSHMAIRCAELGVPAAIGCGEQTFDRVVRAGRVELDCAERKLRPLHLDD